MESELPRLEFGANPRFNLVFAPKEMCLPNEIGKLSVVYAGRSASASGGIPVLSFETMDC